MRRVVVFNSVSLDGYFTDADADMSWAHARSDDAEWNRFVNGNASGGGVLLFGRITYEMMASFWPTPAAMEMMPEVAKAMNDMPKVVFSRSLKTMSWANTTLAKGDPVAEVLRMKSEPGEGITILGSGTVVAQLTQARLVDQYDLVVTPIILGKGRTMFEGVTEPLTLKRTNSRTFRNGKVVLTYEPA